jgi:hypothetical protein
MADWLFTVLWSIWFPLIVSGLAGIWLIWPRLDGGRVPYALAQVVPFWFGAILIFGPWVLWAVVILILGAFNG